jgi:phosphoribosylamine--glycine ligase
MKVGIIGSGGREHAICYALNNINNVKQIYCFPGNAGTAEIAENISLNL